jgi:murein tripeptide amidase MpaA
MITRDGDRGAGLVGTIGGVTVFLVMLSFAVQLLFNLYATSAITAAAHDAAHIAAEGSIDRTDPVAVEHQLVRAEAHARSVLGRYAERVRFEWDVDDDRVRLTVAGQHANLAMNAVAGVFGLNEIERVVEVRVEQTR